MLDAYIYDGLRSPIGRHAGKLAGVRPEEIDIVLITHMHTDHVGGALDAEGRLAFPNARYLINAIEQQRLITLQESPSGR